MKRLEDMNLEELWQLFPIILTAPNPQWKDWATEEVSSLKSLLDSLASYIHHVGSTAINGIWAKPIIDIILETDSRCNFPEINHRLVNSGYICMNETDARLDFNKGYTPMGFAQKVFHIHIRLTGDHDEIYFCEYLNNHPDIAKEYERLKLSLWKPFEHDRDGYTAAKSDFVNRIMALAKPR